jgi:hypothetical protein
VFDARPARPASHPRGSSAARLGRSDPELEPPVVALFVWLISHQPTVVFFSHNKSASAISQTNRLCDREHRALASSSGLPGRQARVLRLGRWLLAVDLLRAARGRGIREAMDAVLQEARRGMSGLPSSTSLARQSPAWPINSSSVSGVS